MNTCFAKKLTLSAISEIRHTVLFGNFNISLNQWPGVCDELFVHIGSVAADPV